MRSLLTVDEAAKLLHIHPTNLRRLISKRKIPFIKREGLGVKFSPDRLEKWIEEASFEPNGKKTSLKVK